MKSSIQGSEKIFILQIQKTILNWLPKWNVVFTKANKQNVKNKNK